MAFKVTEQRSCLRMRGFLLILGLMSVYASMVNYHVLSWLHETSKEGGRPQQGMSARHDEPVEQVQATPRRKSANVASSSPLAIFYNVYVPTGQAAVNRTLGIVQEQIRQVADSAAASMSNEPLSIFYNTIGKRDVVNETFMNALCSERNGMSCQHMKHHRNGFEEVTLQRLYEYCKTHKSSRVIYMHSKGSYHNRGGRNDRWRRQMMNAVTDERCINPPDSTCNVCGLLFQPLPMMHFPGNMFTARCRYINKLLPPNTFTARMSSVADQARVMINETRLSANLYNLTNNHLGIDRYANEHWVGSHPSLVPCDLSKKGTINYWVRQDRDSSEFLWSLSPRSKRPKIDNEQVRSDPTLGRKEYFLLAGNMLRWFKLYDEAPPANSWVWKWYPDAKEWKQATRRFGAKAIDRLLPAAT